MSKRAQTNRSSSPRRIRKGTAAIVMPYDLPLQVANEKVLVVQWSATYPYRIASRPADLSKRAFIILMPLHLRNEYRNLYLFISLLS